MTGALAYAADVAILAAYAAMTSGKPARWFHWANALGCLPIIGVEVQTGAWPALVLTAAFGALGWAGVVRSGQQHAMARLRWWLHPGIHETPRMVYRKPSLRFARAADLVMAAWRQQTEAIRRLGIDLLVASAEPQRERR